MIDGENVPRSFTIRYLWRCRSNTGRSGVALYYRYLHARALLHSSVSIITVRFVTVGSQPWPLIPVPF